MGTERINDVMPLTVVDDTLTIYVDGEPVRAARGETVLSTLFALGKKSISRNDHGKISGAYCGMGICYCCVLNIDEIEKQRACQIIVQENMKVTTQSNRHDKWMVQDV